MKTIHFRLTLSVCFVFLVGCFFAGEGFAQLRGFENAKNAKNNSKAQLFQIDGVAAVGVGSDGEDNAIVKIFTDRRNVNGIPNRIQGVDTETIFVGQITAWHGDEFRGQGKGGNGNGNGNGGGGGDGLGSQDRHPRPVPIGVSCGTSTDAYCFAGTLGCRLKLVNGNGDVVGRYTLSNNHVYAEENQGSVGIDYIIQPGTLDNNCVLDPADDIGTLIDYVAINFNGQPNAVDAAIATASVDDVNVGTPSAGYGTPTSTSAAAFVGQRVQKYGRTTAYTYGDVIAVNVSVTVGYDTGNALFEDQIMIEGRTRRGRREVASSFSAGGDSGSLIVDDSNNPVGLLFAGNSSVTIANPIDTVLDSFSNFQSGEIMMVDDGN